MLVGAHLSVADGYARTCEYAREVGCECMQVFGKSPRQWVGKPIDPEAAERFVRLRADMGLGPLFTHTAYLINLSTTDDVLREKSIVALADEIARGRLLGARGVVTHVGNVPDGDRAAAVRRTARSIDAAFELAGPSATPTRLLLENTAGAGRSFGGEISEIAGVLAEAETGPGLLGMCLDTCHAFAHGIDVAGEDGWAHLLAEIDRTCGVDALGLVHANDCMFDRGSHRDRHAWIGDGTIGDEGFRAMLCALDGRAVCAVTEMPGEIPDKDIVNTSRLKALRDSCGEGTV